MTARLAIPPHSPNAANTVHVENTFVRKDWDAARLCLGDEHPVKGVCMVRREQSRPNRVVRDGWSGLGDAEQGERQRDGEQDVDEERGDRR